jgi:hypothetical protein
MLTRTQRLQRMVAEYRNAGNPWPATMDEVAHWAVVEKRYDRAAPALEKLAAREHAQALREEYFTDEWGRRI